jgi:hypothetical protein
VETRDTKDLIKKAGVVGREGAWLAGEAAWLIEEGGVVRGETPVSLALV